MQLIAIGDAAPRRLRAGPRHFGVRAVMLGRERWRQRGRAKCGGKGNGYN
jgi:hypothetical protein